MEKNIEFRRNEMNCMEMMRGRDEKLWVSDAYSGIANKNINKI